MVETNFDRWSLEELKILVDHDTGHARYDELFKRARRILKHLGKEKGEGVEFIKGVIAARSASGDSGISGDVDTGDASGDADEGEEDAD